MYVCMYVGQDAFEGDIVHSDYFRHPEVGTPLPLHIHTYIHTYYLLTHSQTYLPVGLQGEARGGDWRRGERL